MPGILRTPTDMSAPPPIGPTLSPPIIPNRTQIPPSAMRALGRSDMGLDDTEDDQAESADTAPQTESSLLAEFGNLFWKAGEYPGLQEVMLSFVKALKKASDQRTAVSDQTLLRMPVPVGAPEEPAPRDDLLGSLRGEAR